MESLFPCVTKHLLEVFGNIPKQTKFIDRLRIHQGWWRLSVLNEKAGLHPTRSTEKVCNTINSGETTGKNFLSEKIIEEVKITLNNRSNIGSGIIEEKRLFNNLLSSQPLAFNFFSELQSDKQLGTQLLQRFWPEVCELKKVIFEYSPPQNYTEDNSAFDIAFEVDLNGKNGFIGLECKYTDTFSFKSPKSKKYYGNQGEKHFIKYNQIFKNSETSFRADYYDFVRNENYNQLFRNQLMAEAMEQHGDYEIVKTGLFCYQNDEKAIKAGKEFSKLLVRNKFKVFTYADFIQNLQKLDLSWEQREWSMMLWARYCALQLSENVYQQLAEG